MEATEKKGERNKVIARALGKLWRTCIEFDLLCPNDRVLIGLSGGKDSLLLAKLMQALQRSAAARTACSSLCFWPKQKSMRLFPLT